MKWLSFSVGVIVGVGLGLAVSLYMIQVATSPWPHVNPTGWVSDDKESL